MSAIDVSVVVPVYNNAATLPELIERLTAVIEQLGLSFELVFVDDGSTDGSRELLTRRAADNAQVRAFSLARNFGGQSARCAGFDLARGKRTVTLDADLENLPEDIPALLRALDEGHDLVCGVREERRGAFVARRLPSDALNAYARRVLKTPVRDLWCGMRAMETRVIENLAADGERRRLLTPLLIARARSVAEVPIRHDPAKGGSHHSLLALAAVATDFLIDTARRPFVVAAYASVGAGAGGMALLLAALAAPSATLALAAGVLLVGALLGVLIAAIGDFVQRAYDLEQGRPRPPLAPLAPRL